MGYGELPASSFFRAYWKLENTNDSGVNGFNLTNLNSVTFVQGKFSNGAYFDNGSSNKCLNYTANPLTAAKVNFRVRFWFKLTSTSNDATVRFFVSCHTTPSGWRPRVEYTISGGNITIVARIPTATTDAAASITIPADTNWHYVRVVFLTSGPEARINVDNRVRVDHTGSGATTNGSTNEFSIGNRGGVLTTQAYAIIDEVQLFETSDSLGGEYRYYTQAKGLMRPQII